MQCSLTDPLVYAERGHKLSFWTGCDFAKPILLVTLPNSGRVPRSERKPSIWLRLAESKTSICGRAQRKKNSLLPNKQFRILSEILF
jgi:hypothetical protein